MTTTRQRYYQDRLHAKDAAKRDEVEPIHEGLGRKARILALGVSAAAIIVPAVALIETGERPLDEQRSAALRGVDTIRQQTLILKSGTALRANPRELEPESGSGPRNLVSRVPEGQELVVNSPLEDFVGNRGWIAFTLPGTNTRKINNLNARAEQTVWVNATEVYDQGYAQVIPVPGETDLEAHIDESGRIVAMSENLKSSTFTNSIATSSFDADGTYQAAGNQVK